MKIYDLVYKILDQMPQTRNSDKLLIWEYYKRKGFVKTVHFFGETEAILQKNFLSGTPVPFESITRARRKVQENFPKLGATSRPVKIKRNQIEKMGGNHVYHQEA